MRGACAQREIYACTGGSYRVVLYVPELFRASRIWTEIPASLGGEGPGVLTAVLSPDGQRQASWEITFSHHSP
jgi:hypothetical protein